jgi:dephospho-CoA kinase
VTGHATVLVTGMSGVGKSTALTELARRGYVTVDTDEGPWIEVVEGEPLWRETLIEELLDRPRGRPMFIQGTVANQGRFYDRFDAIVLLSAPTDVVLDRLERRTNNPFGKTVEQRLQILADIAEVEPMLRQAATHEIDTSASLSGGRRHSGQHRGVLVKEVSGGERAVRGR